MRGGGVLRNLQQQKPGKTPEGLSGSRADGEAFHGMGVEEGFCGTYNSRSPEKRRKGCPGAGRTER
ncbi:MAG: hypothetical protein K2P87_09520, partial [Lachnospiraceae bacterium]|nr:hypothetical protein [Lachnospiraceae bacterium]